LSLTNRNGSPFKETEIYIALILFNHPQLCSYHPTFIRHRESTPDDKSNKYDQYLYTTDAALISRPLKGIGLAKAQAIVAYRDSYGAFRLIEELEAVKGIGKATLAKNSDLIVVK